MRYLTRRFAVGAVRRGGVVGQLLGGYDDGSEPGLRVLTVQSDGDAYCLFRHEIKDVGRPDFLDLTEFPPWDEGREECDSGDAVVCSEMPDALLSYAEAELGADPRRWVNDSMLEDEYGDFVRAGRPATLQPPPTS